MSEAVLKAKMIPVPVKNFVSGKVAPVDLYIELSDGHYVKVAKKGDPFDLERLTKYQDRHVDEFYIKPEDFGQHVTSINKIATVISKAPGIAVKKKTSFVAKAAVAVMQELESLDFNPDSFIHAKQICDSVLNIVKENLIISDMLEELGAIDADTLRHSIAVSMIASMLAEALAWKSPKILEDISLAGMMHDIGLKELPKELLTKRRDEMTSDEIVLYESHPYRAAMILGTVQGVPAEVVAMCYDHHEHPNGVGYPRHLKRDRIFPLARIINLADTLSDMILAGTRNPHPKTFESAINYIEVAMLHDFPHDYIAAMNKIKRKR